MLRFKKLEIHNFGPYQGSQVIDFPSDDGVVIVWGYNGFGKTSILKAIRFALWGKILDEHSAEEPLSSYVNHDAVERCENMEVILHMTYDDQEYVLTRCLERRENSGGEDDSDYIFDVFLQKGTDIVSPAECNHFLKTAIPEAIARFYLFDGELLQQYENLLKSENDNSVIKDAIEDILGLPILEISKDNLGIIEGEYSDVFTRASTADERTKQAGVKLAGLKEKEDELKGNRSKLQADLNEAIVELGKIDAKLEETSIYRSYTQDIKACEAVISAETENLEALKERVRDDLDSLWEAYMKAVVDKELNTKIAQRSALSQTLSKQNENQTIHAILIKLLEKHGADCNCPICNATIDDKAVEFIKEQLSTYASGIDPTVKKAVSDLDTEIHILQGLEYSDNTSVVKSNLKLIDDTITKIKLKEIEKGRLEDDRRKVGSDSAESAIESLIPERDTLVRLIENYKKGVEGADAALLENKANREKVMKKIAKEQASIEIDSAQKELETCHSINSLFEEAIEKFKQNLKENVQTDATTYFTSVAHNPDYKELSINEEYGLEIITKSGAKVPHRSSGYVQVVAISLIAALHKNAPISGPIIMDSTFQRIDPRHKNKILESLPSLGRQVIVLAYPDEIQETAARNILRGKLRKEVTIEQLSSFNSVIKQ